MLKNQALYDFMCERSKELTEQWYETLDKSKGGVYGSTDPQTIEKVKRQNYEFHLRFCSMFIKAHDEFFRDFQQWIVQVAKDEAHLATPLADILEEFFRTQKQYFDLIKEFTFMNKEAVSYEQFAEWNQGVALAISEIVREFTIQNSKSAERRLNAQQEMIIEMSAPVILLTKDIGLLPLIGEINTYRAHIIFEKALSQSVRHNLETLFIDLSGVPIIDTMVAHQIFQLISGLKLIGVKTALSGIGPDIAQTAVQLGINFTDIEIYNTLAQAIKIRELKII